MRFIDTVSPFANKKTEITNEASSISAAGAGNTTLLERAEADRKKDQLTQKLEHLARAVNDASSTIKLSYSVERIEPDVKGKIGVFVEFSTKEGHDKFLQDMKEVMEDKGPVLKTVKSVSVPDKVNINGKKRAGVSFSIERGINDDDNVKTIAGLMKKSSGKVPELVNEFSQGNFSSIEGKRKIPLDNKVLGITTLAL